MTDKQLATLRKLQALERAEQRHEKEFWKEVESREKEVVEYINKLRDDRRSKSNQSPYGD